MFMIIVTAIEYPSEFVRTANDLTASIEGDCGYFSPVSTDLREGLQ